MKKFKTIVILYTIIMLLIPVISYFVYRGINVTVSSPSSYTDEELVIYRQIWDGMNENVEAVKKEMFVTFLIFWAVVFVLGYVLFLYIYIKEIKPILQLSSFATEISKGNLDVPLPMNKNNGFVDFTEGFDIMREELKASKAREIEAENLKREMVAELSHDLKTPIATIQATCEVLNLQAARKKDNCTPERLKELEDLEEKIGFITKKADMINELIKNVFRATLDDMDEIKVSVEEYGSTIIEDYFKGLKEYGNIILDNHIPECLIYMDRLRMEQVVDNIVGNSYKYAGTDIHVSFGETEEMTDKQGNKIKFLRITVKDSGPGVPESDLPLISEKYYRGNNAKERTGYGLGLYLVKNYMERQGGGMEYYNDNGFTVELLVKKV
ncbi:MAG: HAMP domain-containing histidine kinase [Lachnospiraceae bacterium]|nr:HAMP domain-containing histidine kinase [Lachnospiraceae bacterium]